MCRSNFYACRSNFPISECHFLNLEKQKGLQKFPIHPLQKPPPPPYYWFPSISSKNFLSSLLKPFLENLIPHPSPLLPFMKETRVRLCKPKNSFKYETKKNTTELSKYIQDKMKNRQETSLNWYTKEKAKAYSPVKKRYV